MNDPGTAINIMAIMMNLFVQEPEPQSEADVVEYDRLSIAQLDCAEWIRDAFAPISRDGAGILEVNVVMQKCSPVFGVMYQKKPFQMPPYLWQSKHWQGQSKR